jgi:prepilin-type N-terminal cleavage/methylation domain-containing protein
MKNLQGSRGFTLLEMLIVLAIIAILTPLVYNFIGRQTAVLQVENAGQTVANAFNEARSGARKTSRDWQVRVKGSTSTGVFKVGVCNTFDDCATASSWKEETLVGAVKVQSFTGANWVDVGASNTILETYIAPYSRTTATDFRLRVVSNNFTDLASTIVILGVTGKVNKLERRG